MEVSPLRKFPKNTTTTTTVALSPLRPNIGKKGGKTKRVWKLKVNITWKAIKTAVISTVRNHHHFPMTCRATSTVKQLSKENHIRKPLSQLFKLHIPHTAASFIDRGDFKTPSKTPRQSIATMWREIHGSNNWENLLDPLHPLVRQEVTKYGEFTQATYDAFDCEPLSEYYGSCRYNRHKLFEELHLNKHGYKVTKYIYAMSHVDVPQWFEKSHREWSKDSNWMGYVAVSNDEESNRIGRRDIVMAWRGTVQPTEWFMDLMAMQEKIGPGNIKVQHGFYSIYTSKSETTRYNKLSASEQVMQEVLSLVNHYTKKGEQVSFTTTGHSLGGALAALNAYEAASKLPAGVPISVISFGAPRVGNFAFKNKLSELGVKTLRIVVKQDLVPKLPGFLTNRVVNKLNAVTQKLNWVYRHVGVRLKLDMYDSPYLKKESDILGSHNLEIYLHLLDGYLSKGSEFRWNARRDVALVNKSTDMLKEDLRIPEFWYQLPHRGLVFNHSYGRWVKPGRQPEDIPTPRN